MFLKLSGQPVRREEKGSSSESEKTLELIVDVSAATSSTTASDPRVLSEPSLGSPGIADKMSLK